MPGKTDKECSEEIADYFVQISDEFDPLESVIGSIGEGIRAAPEIYRIAGRLRSMRKPKSQVLGDIPPDLATEYADVLAIPLSHIF